MKTPKDKAKELFEKYFDMKWQSYLKRTASIKSMTKSAAKQCALIAVDEIMYNNLMEYPQHSMIYSPHKNDYWNQVKEEINKL